MPTVEQYTSAIKLAADERQGYQKKMQKGGLTQQEASALQTKTRQQNEKIMKNLEKLAELVRRKIEKGERIVIPRDLRSAPDPTIAAFYTDTEASILKHNDALKRGGDIAERSKVKVKTLATDAAQKAGESKKVQASTKEDIKRLEKTIDDLKRRHESLRRDEEQLKRDERRIADDRERVEKDALKLREAEARERRHLDQSTQEKRALEARLRAERDENAKRKLEQQEKEIEKRRKSIESFLAGEIGEKKRQLEGLRNAVKDEEKKLADAKKRNKDAIEDLADRKAEAEKVLAKARGNLKAEEGRSKKIADAQKKLEAAVAGKS